MKKYLFILTALILVTSCSKRTEDESEGPNVFDVFGDFQLLSSLEVSNPDVDFSAGETTHFEAIFNKIIDWELEIIGQTSGARKIIGGTSSEIDVSNSNWIGNTTDLPMFTNEDCDVTLTFATDTTTLTQQLTIEGIKTNEGFVLTDFEDGFNSDWLSFVQSGADMSFNIVNDVYPAQGEFYYDMGGEVNWDWLIGMIEFPADAYENGFDVSSNASQVYFNVFLYVPEGIVNELILFQFREDDNQDGVFNESSEDMYSMEISGLNAGWNRISIKYDDIQVLVNGQPSTPNGNALHEPNKIDKLSVLFLANPDSGYSQTLMDYLIFTEGAPLNP